MDFSYSLALAEELGSITCSAIPTSIGVQSDMCTPALSRYRKRAQNNIHVIGYNLLQKIKKNTSIEIYFFFAKHKL